MSTVAQVSSSALVASKFDNTGSFLATVVVALDTHQVRVVSVNQSGASLDTSYNLPNDNKVSTLSWIPFQEQEQLLALGLTNGSILLYSPLTNAILTRLSTSSSSLITDFKYSDITKSLWASDITGVIYEWGMDYSLIQKISINESLTIETTETVNSIAIINHNSQPHLLAGSQSIYLVNIKTKEVLRTIPAHIQPIHSIVSVPTDDNLFISCANGDRFINLYSLNKSVPNSVFVTDSPVTDISVGTINDKSILIARTETGNVEVFNSFLSEDVPAVSQSNSRKKKRQQLTNSRSRHADGVISLEQVDLKGSVTPNLPVVSVIIKQNLVLYSWLEDFSVPIFDTLRWLDEKASNSIVDKVNLSKTKQESSVPHHAMNGHDVASAKHYNEGNAIVSDGYNLNHVVEDDEDEEDGEALADKLAKLATDAKTVTPKKTKKQNGINNNTLTTILSQSLKNNDHSLLETVLTNRDQQVIQNTIARLDSSMAIVLLDRISERIARQANRFDQLVYWLKWIIIIHGGVLSSLPGLAAKFSNLHGILSRKADTLPRLLQLQNRMQIINEFNDSKKSQDHPYDGSEDEESDVEYVEELDDANLLNGDFHSGDDYVDSDDMEEDSEEEVDAHGIAAEDFEVDKEDEEGYSDEEIAVDNKDVEDSDEE
ncbi:Small subunit (SSU) processome component [Yamadazyma tenuis]|uniref:NUC189-domain-containing protein n=1 Tax=Candida tenuis (strain ATCC 10573 / BCRC 21748 / CBS 615 / JCM 9827 / NBRC 10315 / NRRL Y-1498 / VKM Y-70) TaxID=590646 RepID=G3AXJ5_CANTC|nr:NUC189-domain-containing protein [Yamadazyma tenuis ATCC 10573]EGV66401.1 NUC189-domain-containing protein [Yamadazyma tenuis ATCC 10573]WEJ95484.1 Small subunit (SSU) processome component [Yamadazyma tenuis]